MITEEPPGPRVWAVDVALDVADRVVIEPPKAALTTPEPVPQYGTVHRDLMLEDLVRQEVGMRWWR